MVANSNGMGMDSSQAISGRTNGKTFQIQIMQLVSSSSGGGGIRCVRSTHEAPLSSTIWLLDAVLSLLVPLGFTDQLSWTTGGLVEIRCHSPQFLSSRPLGQSLIPSQAGTQSPFTEQRNSLGHAV